MDYRDDCAPKAGTEGARGMLDVQRPCHSTFKPKVPHKWARVLAALLTGRRFHRFEAERELADHCLHSTVATIQGKGVRVSRRDITIPGFQGIATHVCQYWIDPDPENVARARALLEAS